MALHSGQSGSDSSCPTLEAYGKKFTLEQFLKHKDECIRVPWLGTGFEGAKRQLRNRRKSFLGLEGAARGTARCSKAGQQGGHGAAMVG